MNKIFFDIETTGFNYRVDDRIIEVAAVEFGPDNLPTGRFFHSLVDPCRDIPELIVTLTGIDNAKVAGAPKFEEIVHEFLTFIEGAEVIAHNGDSFDAPFINFEMQRAAVPYTFWEKPGRVSDSLKLARQAFPKQRVSLDMLMKNLGVDASERERVGHNALLDCKLLAEVYYKMVAGLSDVDMAAADHETDKPRAPIVRIAAFSLPSISVSPLDLARHEQTLDALEKKAGKPSVARTAQTASPARSAPRP